MPLVQGFLLTMFVEMTERKKLVEITEGKKPVEITERKKFVEMTERKKFVEMTERKKLVEITGKKSLLKKYKKPFQKMQGQHIGQKIFTTNIHCSEAASKEPPTLRRGRLKFTFYGNET